MIKAGTVRELINQEISIDVVDDYTEELYIAFEGPQELTEAGQKEFSDIMDFPVFINPHSFNGYPLAIIEIDGADDKTSEHRLKRVKLFFESCAGFCPVDNYEKWFGNLD